jgi:2-enoate reductase
VVVGGGAVGCEVAHFLASEHGKKVKVVEMLPVFMTGMCTANRGHLIHELERIGVELINCASLKAIQPGSITLVRNVSPTVPDPYNTWTPLLPENIPNPLGKPIRQDLHEIDLPADAVVLALGLRSNTSLYDACLQAGVAPEIRRIGDAFSPRRVFEAVKAGYAVGRSL